MSGSIPFPFTAISAQEKLKLALILCAVNPLIGGVLISGEKGTSKSTAVRALAAVSGRKMIEIPLNVTEDRLVGTLRLTEFVKNSERNFEKGLLSDADGNFLYIDEINLLGKHISGILTEVISSGENIVQRDGVSYSHSCRCIPIGTMNPEEGSLNPQLLDKFGLFVNVTSENDIDTRTEIIRRRLEYEKSAKELYDRFSQAEAELSERISRAENRVEKIDVPYDILQLIALTVSNAGCEGNRCEIVLAETAKALCAWRGGKTVSEPDVSEAAGMVLPHRMRAPVQPMKMEKSAKSGNSGENSEPIEPTEQADMPSEGSISTEPNEIKSEITETPDEELPISIGAMKSSAGKNGGSGKRSKTVTSEKNGRYIRSVIPHGECRDIALIPTFCTAALNRHFQISDGRPRLLIKASDLRKKVRERRKGASILFVVDSSGSMGAKRRMRAVKGAVKGLLSEAYQKRDRVGVVSFRGSRADILLSITGSPELARKRMDELPTGGKTPLADGIFRACELLRAERIRNPDVLQYLILISDGKANVPLFGGEPFDDALKAADMVRGSGVGAMVLDAENGYIRFGFAKQIAERMNAEYIALDEVTASAVEENVRNFITDD